MKNLNSIRTRLFLNPIKTTAQKHRYLIQIRNYLFCLHPSDFGLKIQKSKRLFFNLIRISLLMSFRIIFQSFSDNRAFSFSSRKATSI
nr:MAG TPA: hypothetical protein [Caudoviricetes sp.]